MSQLTEERLRTLIWAFHAAVQRRDGIEARLRNGEHAGDLRDRSLSAAEAVVEARVAFYKLLINEGWAPPRSVALDIEYDDTVLRQTSRELLVEP
ncbi:MAG: hypothetical protein JWL79_3815 [Frankiales bacterium]|jgi:hypothetical protein|nr:hypothetical protein [Frankiales bacterium]